MKPIKTIEEANPSKTASVSIYKFTPEELKNIKPVDFDTFVDFPGTYKGDFSFEKEAALQRAVTLKEGNFTKYKKNDFISNGYYLAKVAGWLPAQETELLPDMSLRHHWYQNINYRVILYKTPNLHEKYVDTYEERPLYIYVYHYVDIKNTLSHLTTSLSEPMCQAIHIPKWFTYGQKKTVNSLLGKTKKEKQAWLKDYFISSAKATNSILRLDFDDSKDWELATTDTVTKYLNKLEVDYGRKCSKMLKKLEEDRLLIEISRLAEGVKLPSGVKGKKSKPIPKKEDFDILL